MKHAMKLNFVRFVMAGCGMFLVYHQATAAVTDCHITDAERAKLQQIYKSRDANGRQKMLDGLRATITQKRSQSGTKVNPGGNASGPNFTPALNESDAHRIECAIDAMSGSK